MKKLLSLLLVLCMLLGMGVNAFADTSGYSLVYVGNSVSLTVTKVNGTIGEALIIPAIRPGASGSPTPVVGFNVDALPNDCTTLKYVLLEETKEDWFVQNITSGAFNFTNATSLQAVYLKFDASYTDGYTTAKSKISVNSDVEILTYVDISTKSIKATLVQNNGTVTISFDNIFPDNPDPGYGYQVVRSVGGSSEKPVFDSTKTTGMFSMGNGLVTFNDTPPSAGTYTYEITAYDPFGNSSTPATCEITIEGSAGSEEGGNGEGGNGEGGNTNAGAPSDTVQKPSFDDNWYEEEIEEEDNHTTSSDMDELIEETSKNDTEITIDDVTEETTISKKAMEKAIEEGLNVEFKGDGYVLTLKTDDANFDDFKGNFNPYIDTDAGCSTSMKSELKKNDIDLTNVQVIKTKFSGKLPGAMELEITLEKELRGENVYFYYWNPELKQYELIPHTVKGHKIVVSLSHFSNYIITSEPIVGAITRQDVNVVGVTTVDLDKTNPETGASDFVGVAAALALVSVLGGAALSMKK